MDRRGSIQRHEGPGTHQACALQSSPRLLQETSVPARGLREGPLGAQRTLTAEPLLTIQALGPVWLMTRTESHSRIPDLEESQPGVGGRGDGSSVRWILNLAPWPLVHSGFHESRLASGSPERGTHHLGLETRATRSCGRVLSPPIKPGSPFGGRLPPQTAGCAGYTTCYLARASHIYCITTLPKFRINS